MVSSSSYSAIVRLDWFGKQVNLSVSAITRRRVGAATTFLHEAIIANISKPVGKIAGPKGGITKARSKVGEYPRLDTGTLSSNLVRGVVVKAPGVWDGYVGVPDSVVYGVFLEAFMGRAFLTRTLFEESATIRIILTKPMKGLG